MTRDELIEVMARAIHEERQKAGFGGEASWEHEPKSIHALHLHTATAALAALEAAGVRLVPSEPSRHMLLAAHMVESDDIELTEDEHRAMYAAFLAASPYAPPKG